MDVGVVNTTAQLATGISSISLTNVQIKTKKKNLLKLFISPFTPDTSC